MGEAADRFCYVYSCDLDTNIEIKIGTLEGLRERPNYKELLDDPMLKFSGVYQEGCSDLYVTCQIFSEGLALGLPVSTSYKAFSSRWNWNEWIRLPVKYSDLPRNAVLTLTVWDIYGTNQHIPVGGTTMNLFGKRGTFAQGMHDLRVWPKVKADASKITTTPGKIKDSADEISRLAKLSKKHRDGHMVKVDWLDRLTFTEIEMINEREKRNSNFMYLMIEFPHIHYEGTEFSIIYFEKDADKPFEYRTQAEIVTVPDPEILLENLVESKHHKLARSLRSGPTDRDMKPDAKTRDHLNNIVAYPPTKQLTSEEQDLVWKFRFYLSTQNKALTKFLKCVNWSLPQEAKQALELLNRWSPMDVDDALELLGPGFTHPAVRKYAVMRLRQADDDDLLLYLLQLVQALKYENFEEIKQGYDAAISESSPSPETPPTPEKDRSSSVMSRSTSQDSILEALSKEIDRDGAPEKTLEDEMDLATYLISRSCNNFKVSNYFYWYLHVECEDQGTAAKEDSKIKEMYLTVLKRFSQALLQKSKVSRATLASQQLFIDRLVKLVKIVTRESGNRKKKIERLQALLQDVDVCKMNFAEFETLPLPLDPDVKVTGIIPDSATLFKSALMPCRLTFRTSEGEDFITIFKHGDDLRQDQLILQSIELMDKLLRKENLDLRMSPYKVLATSSKHGFVQFIESHAVAEVLDKDGTIQNFFRKHAPAENGPYGIAPEIMDNYVKSCAGYSIVTYLLGVGDRHLDNLLLTTSGKLFHIDFGYILGRDPKPLPPPMKLSKEMVEAMGGPNSEHFHDFKKYCYTAFLALRRSSNLIMNLFSLMVNANIPDIALEPDKTVKKVQEKFVLHYTDEEAVHYIQSLIDVSTSAMMPALVEQLHKMAQYWRK